MPADAPALREEVFGPVMAVVPFEHPDEALERANDTECGLASFVWTRDLRTAARLSEADVVALAERELALLIRAPLPGEFIPEPTAVRQWMPLVQATKEVP